MDDGWKEGRQIGKEREDSILANNEKQTENKKRVLSFEGLLENGRSGSLRQNTPRFLSTQNANQIP